MWNESHNANVLTHTKYRSGIAEYIAGDDVQISSYAGVITKT